MKRTREAITPLLLALFTVSGCAHGLSDAQMQVDGQQRTHAMLEMLPMPPAPTAEICRQAGATTQPLYLCLADVHASAACDRPTPEDMRPYTLCLAETYDEDVERELTAQLEAAFRRARASRGAVGVARLKSEQDAWEKQRKQTCGAEFDAAPIPEQARADLTCNARLAASRVAQLGVTATPR